MGRLEQVISEDLERPQTHCLEALGLAERPRPAQARPWSRCNPDSGSCAEQRWEWQLWPVRDPRAWGLVFTPTASALSTDPSWLQNPIFQHSSFLNPWSPSFLASQTLFGPMNEQMTHECMNE